jgi:protein disulfide-isomerase A6
MLGLLNFMHLGVDIGIFINFIFSKKLAPEWAKLATALKGEVKVAKIDASGENFKHKDKYKVEGYPTIRFFGAGEKVDGDFESYDGAREYSALLNYAKETYRRLKPLFFE